MITLRKLTFSVFGILLWSATLSYAGIDVDFEREVNQVYSRILHRIHDLQHQVASMPAYQQSEELETKLHELAMRSLRLRTHALTDTYLRQHSYLLPGLFDKLFERDLFAQDNADTALLRDTLKLETEIEELERQLNRGQKVIGDFEEQIKTKDSQVYFKNARNRVATFTFDDPDQTGIGDQISFLLAKKMLFSTRVADFAVVNYREGTGKVKKVDLAYFDKVDLIVRDQGFLLAVWGRISWNKDGVRLDSFLQVPTGLNNTPFVQSIRLPKAMGSGGLTARIKPDRILAQSIDLNAEDIKAIRQAAADVAVLREAPEVGSHGIGELTNNQPYRIVGSQGQWVRLSAGNGVLGWTSVDAFCRGGCQKVLDTSILANDVLAATAGKSNQSSLPQTISREARAFSDQLTSLEAVRSDPRRATELVGHWLGKSVSSDGMPTDGAKLPISGEAGFAVNAGGKMHRFSGTKIHQ